VNTWKCSCGLENSVDRLNCELLSSSKVTNHSFNMTLAAINALEIVAVGVKLAYRANLAGRRFEMTDREDKFAKFFQHELSLIADMPIGKLNEHRAELEEILFEAKARLTAIDEKHRTEKAKLSTSQRDWLTTRDNSEVTKDAINVVQMRKSRMSKADKLREQLKAAGFEEEDIKTTISAVENRVTNKGMRAITFQSNKPKPVVEQLKPANPDGNKPMNANVFTSFFNKEK